MLSYYYGKSEFTFTQDHDKNYLWEGSTIARFIQNSRKQKLFLTVDLCRQLIPGTPEYTKGEIVEHKLDIKELFQQFNNDDTGASAIILRTYKK